VRLGDGWGSALSSDGKWVAAIPTDGSFLTLLPTGVGETRTVRYPQVESILKVRYFPDDRRLLFAAKDRKGDVGLYVGDVDGKNLRVIARGLRPSPDGLAVSPDGALATAVGSNGTPRLVSTSDGGPRSAPGLERGDLPLRFSTDGRRLFVARVEHAPAMIHRVDLASGRREPWKELKAGDSAGVWPSTAIQITPDGRFYAYTYRQFLNELVLVSGLKPGR
jgi:hypothetical protein